jgi:hypothetical protein
MVKVLTDGLYLKPSEMCFVQYMPISVPGTSMLFIPKNLEWVAPITNLIRFDDEWKNHYVYLTAKHLWVDSDNPGNRKGWHIDGYLSDDVNWVWCDRNPTEYVPYLDSQEFDEEHIGSLAQMHILASRSTVHEIPVNTVVDMERTVHRVKENILPGMRTFVKLSFSKHKYNLQGNAINPCLDLGWKMYPREEGRNHPYVGEKL